MAFHDRNETGRTCVRPIPCENGTGRLRSRPVQFVTVPAGPGSHAGAGRHVDALRVPEEEEAGDKGHQRDPDRIPEAGIDIAGRCHHGGGEQRQHAAEPAVADVIGQRHRRVAYLGREHLDQEGRDRPVHHRHVDHHDDDDQLRHEPVDLGQVGLGRIAGGGERLRPGLRVPAVDVGVVDRQRDLVARARRVLGLERDAELGDEVLGAVAGVKFDHGPTKMWKLHFDVSAMTAIWFFFWNASRSGLT